MIINSLQTKYDNILNDYENALSSKKELESQLKEIIYLFDTPELLDDESIDELCEILSVEDAKKIRTIQKYLKIINKYPNQSQIIYAKNVLNEVKESLISLVTIQCDEIMNSIDIEQLKYRNIYMNEMNNLNNYNQINISLIYELICSLKEQEINDEVIEFLSSLIKNNIDISNDLNDINFKYYLIIDNFINKLKDNMSDAIDEKSLIISMYLKKILANEYVSSKDLKTLDLCLKSNKLDEYTLNRMKFLLHLYKVDIEYDDEQIKFLNDLFLTYSNLSEEEGKHNMIKTNKQFISELEDDCEYTDIDLLNEIYNENNISQRERAEVLCSIIFQNKVKNMNNIKRR